jgi:2-keto-3-deoxy-L-rhamnonate aldolase RhmA
MANQFERQLALKTKIRSGTPTLGLFVKTPSPSVIEVLAPSGVDFLVFDAEHAPFSIEALDTCLLAARAAGILALVRVDAMASSLAQSVLDMGAAGVVFPHIRSAAQASEAVAATRYLNGTRGFSASHRAAGYGSQSMSSYCDSSDKATIVIGQIEDAGAVECIDDIVATEGLDALFIGAADLAISFGVNQTDHALVDNAINTICTASRKTQQSVGMFIPSAQCIDQYMDQYRPKGVSVFFISSDQALLSAAASGLVKQFNSAIL